MPRTVMLEVLEGKLAGERFIFEENGAYVIGRAPSCAFRIPDDVDLKISRRHLMLVVSDSEVRLRDLGSRNGTEVNGKLLPPGKINKVPEAITDVDYVLKPGDVVKTGDLVFTFEFVAEESPKPLPVLLTPKPGRVESDIPPPPEKAVPPSPAPKPTLALKKSDVVPAESLSDKDIFEKLGTHEETVEMEAEEFDNLDDLVFHPPERKEAKRSTKFKIKQPGAPKPSGS
jgi:predicted component of type VI protein secretion system